MTFLEEIIKAKHERVEAAKARLPVELLREMSQPDRAGPHRFAEALRDRSRPNIIAEFKRRSPSKGPIKTDAAAAATAKIYESAGAAAISVLTEEDYFEGSLDDLREIRGATALPLLRKDFIFDEYQIYESAAAGADALLLIVATLDDPMLARLRAIAEDDLGMDALVEVHTADELRRAQSSGARLIGVNNRNLHTFEVSTATSIELAAKVAPEVLLVSESGLTPPDIPKLRKAGYSGFLVGELLMRSADPARAIRDFIYEPGAPAPRSALVKICGITNLEDAEAAIEAGADMLGFNFYRPSPRFVESATAHNIISAVRVKAKTSRAQVTMVGVFVNEPVEDVARIAAEVGLDGVQLHGEETADYLRRLKQAVPRQFLVKVIRPNGAIDLAPPEVYPSDAYMIDAYDPKLHGGTGRTTDWTLARDAADKLPRLFLAGGLSPENVAEAIAAVRPYAVDACSALEVSPGRKDHARLREFVAAVRASKLPTAS